MGVEVELLQSNNLEQVLRLQGALFAYQDVEDVSPVLAICALA